MFSGLSEEIGLIKSFKKTKDGATIEIEASKILEDIKIGDSISINGACQSVVDFGANWFKVETTNETLTTIKPLKTGDKVNLERALKLNGRLGGHLVSGHVDFTAVVKEIINDGFSKRIKFSAQTKYIVKKGSITVDGISLTVSNVEKDAFEVSLIPQTLKDTTLKDLKINDYVNVEVDMLAKYVEKFLFKEDNSSKITENFLKENGF